MRTSKFKARTKIYTQLFFGKILLLSLILLASTLRAHAINPPKVALNHFYVTLDESSFNAVENSQFLKETFGVFEKRTTTQGNNVYTGIYLYGDDTYLEFFNQADASSRAPSAIAFGVDGPGEMLAISPNLNISRFTRLWNGQDIPWFQFGLNPAPESARIYTWMMEYEPSFLELWHPELATPLGVSRSAILERYAAAVGVRQQDRLLQNIRSIWLELDSNESADFLSKAKAYGCTIAKSRNLTTVRTATENIFLQKGPRNRILAAEFALRWPVPFQLIPLGSTMLLIRENSTALWVFQP